MAVTLIASGSKPETGDNTITLPAATEAGDLLVYYLWTGGQTLDRPNFSRATFVGGSDEDLTLLSNVDLGNLDNMRVLYGIVPSGATHVTAAVTGQYSYTCVVYAIVRGFNESDPITLLSNTGGSGTTQTASGGSSTTTGAYRFASGIAYEPASYSSLSIASGLTTILNTSGNNVARGLFGSSVNVEELPSDDMTVSGGTPDSFGVSDVLVNGDVVPADPASQDPRDRYRSNVSADAGSLLPAVQAVPFDVSSSIAFSLAVNLDQTVNYPFKEVTRDQAGSVSDALFLPRARQALNERAYEGITLLTLMERNYPSPIFDTTENLGLGATATAQQIVTYVLQQWATWFDWFTFATVPDLRTRTPAMLAPSEYGMDDGLIEDSVITIRQDGDQRQTMRQILDDLLSPFPGTIYYQDSSGDLVIKAAYGPDADGMPVTTFQDSDVVTISRGEPDAFNIVNRATATVTRYTRQEQVATMQPAWFQIVSNGLMESPVLFDPPADRLNLSGETTDDESTRQADAPTGSFAAENAILNWPIDTSSILAGDALSLTNDLGDPMITAAFVGSRDTTTISHSGTILPADILVTDIPLSGSWVDAIRIDEADFQVTIRARWNAQHQRVEFGLGSPMTLESGGVYWALEFTLNDSSVAYDQAGTRSATFGVVEDGDTAPNASGGNAIQESQTAYGIIEETIDIRGYGSLTASHLADIAQGYVLENINPKATRELDLSWKGGMKALFDRRGRLVGTPGSGEGILTGVEYTDDYSNNMGSKRARVEEVIAGAAGVIDTEADWLLNDDGSYWQDDDGSQSEAA